VSVRAAARPVNMAAVRTRVAIATFWRTFHHDGKISPVWCVVRVGGASPPPFTISTVTYKVAVYTPAERADTLPLFLLYPYMYSALVRTGDLRTEAKSKLPD
jgi:hypothetical protein